MLNCGIEIEFLSGDYRGLLLALVEQDIEFFLTGNNRETSTEHLIIKPDLSTRGFEFNIPPNYTEEQLQLLCTTIGNYAYTSDLCAMHIHIPVTQNDLSLIEEYYIAHQVDIIQAAKDQNLYVNMNRNNVENDTLQLRRTNMNTVKAFRAHGTVEHRIYKSTFDYNKIMWAVNQTKEIINEALS